MPCLWHHERCACLCSRSSISSCKHLDKPRLHQTWASAISSESPDLKISAGTPPPPPPPSQGPQSIPPPTHPPTHPHHLSPGVTGTLRRAVFTPLCMQLGWRAPKPPPILPFINRTAPLALHLSPECFWLIWAPTSARPSLRTLLMRWVSLKGLNGEPWGTPGLYSSSSSSCMAPQATEHAASRPSSPCWSCIGLGCECASCTVPWPCCITTPEHAHFRPAGAQGKPGPAAHLVVQQPQLLRELLDAQLNVFWHHALNMPASDVRERALATCTDCGTCSG